jgi:membrane associated rhomboid family serine protease
MIGQLFNNLPPVVKNLLIINILFYLATVVFEAQGIYLSSIFGMHYPASPLFRPMQLVSYMFMHGNFSHLLFNMIMLIVFGPVLERIWGPKRFLTFYFVTGIGAVVLYIVVGYFEFREVAAHLTEEEIVKLKEYVALTPANMTIQFPDTYYKTYFDYLHTGMVGASGALFGIFVAFGVLFPNTELMLLFFPVPIKAKYFIPFMILLELYLGVMQFSGDNVAHFAHLGGALIGYILLRFWQKKKTTFY